MKKKNLVLKYLIFDILAAGTAWTLFYIFRKVYIESVKYGYQIPIELGINFFLGLFFIPLFWIIFYYLTSFYKDIYRKSRLKELGQTLFITIIGVIIIFFTLILDDVIITYKNYYLSFFTLFSFHFVLTYIPRYILTTKTIHKIHKRIIGFKTILIGSNEKAVDIYQDIQNQKISTGNDIIGFISLNKKEHYQLSNYLKNLGSLKNLKEVIHTHNIEEVIIAIESSEHDEIGKIINTLNDTNVIIKVIPYMYDILTGKVKMSSIIGTPLIHISHDLMPLWQKNIKQFFDIFISVLALVILFPLCIVIVIGIKLTSKGAILYSHERIGQFGKPFTIYKFRSMYHNAEKNEPELSNKNDKRITPIGRFMREAKLDEIPNFYNVIIGDMSIVGPRPERKYFIDRIIKKAPHYIHLQKVKPGITSWGQIKYGYAENVDEMIKRLNYDIIYIKNISLYVDFKIIIYTILAIFKRSYTQKN